MNRRQLLNLAIPAAELRRDRVRQLVRRAEVILGFDLATGEVQVALGWERVRTAPLEQLSAMVVSYDSRVQNLGELLVQCGVVVDANPHLLQM